MGFLFKLVLAAIASMHTDGAERRCNSAYHPPRWIHPCGCNSVCGPDNKCTPPVPGPAPIPPPKVPVKDLPEKGEASGFLWDTHITAGSICGKTEPDRFGKVKLDTCIKANETNFPLEAFYYHGISPGFKSFMVTCGTCWEVPYVLFKSDDCTGDSSEARIATQQCRVATGHSFSAVLCKKADELIV